MGLPKVSQSKAKQFLIEMRNDRGMEDSLLDDQNEGARAMVRKQVNSMTHEKVFLDLIENRRGQQNDEWIALALSR